MALCNLLMALGLAAGICAPDIEPKKSEVVAEGSETQQFPMPFPVEIIETDQELIDKQDLERQVKLREEESLRIQGYELKISLASTTLIFLSTVFLGFTLIFTHRTLRVTKLTLDTTKDIGKRQTRAYVGVSNTDVKNSNGIITCIVEIQNCGNSPALEVHHWIKANGTGNCTFAEPEKPTKPFPLMPGGSAILDISVQLEAPYPVDTPAKFANPLYVWGRVDYLDTYKEKQYMEYRFEVVPDTAGRNYLLTPCWEGNTVS
ncbi:hypothetical protein ACSSV1_001928 [Labrenzia sp. MBR-25]